MGIMVGGICIPKSPKEMTVEERNEFLHSVLVRQMLPEWETIKGHVTDLYKPVLEALKGETPGVRHKVLVDFWKSVPSDSIPEGLFLKLASRSPKGYTQFFKTLGEMVDRDAGTLNQAQLVKTLRRNKGFRTRYYSMMRKIGGYLDTMGNEAVGGGEVPLESDLARIKGHSGEVPIAANVGDPIRPGSWATGIGEYMLDLHGPARDSLVTSTGLSQLLPTKEAFRSLGKTFGRGVMRIWTAGETHRRTFNEEMHKVYKELEGIFGEFVSNQQVLERVTSVAERAHLNPEHDLYSYFKANPPTTAELEMASGLRKFFDEKGARWGVPTEWYVTDYMPRVRAHGTFKVPGLSQGNLAMSKFIDAFFKHERTGQLSPREMNAFKLAVGYARVGFRQELFETSGFNSSVQEVIGAMKAYPQAQRVMRNYLDDITGGYTNEIAFHKQSVRYLDKALGKAGVPEGTAEKLRVLLSKFTYAGALGLRGLPLIKQLSQITIHGGSLFGKYLADGAKAATTSEGWAYVRSLGIPVENFGATELGEEVTRALDAEKGWLGRLSKWSDYTLLAYKKADTVNRVTGFFAGKSMFETETRNLWAGKITQEQWTKAVKYHWFDGMDDMQALMEQVAGKPGDVKALSHVGDEVGRHLTEDINWIYRKGNAPGLVRQHPVVMQFGTWPANYASFVKHLVEYAKVSGDYGPLSRFASMNGAVYAMSLGTGVDFRGIIGAPSAFYTGGPIPSLGLDTMSMLKDAYYGSDMVHRDWNEMMRDMQVYLPAGLAIRYGYEGLRDGDVLQAFGLRGMLPK